MEKCNNQEMNILETKGIPRAFADIPRNCSDWRASRTIKAPIGLIDKT